MFFNSWQFVAFIIPTLCMYYMLPHRGQNRLLLACSYLFYGAWDWRFLSLIWISTLVDYFIAHKMAKEDREGRRKALLVVSLAVNLGFLGFFKYFNFFSDSLSVLLTGIGLPPSPFILDVVLPVGISFYTFQTLSYTIDVYRGKLTPCRNILDFALFVAFFPQLVAGPIERASSLLPQLLKRRTVQRDMVLSGLWLILWGYFKKVVIADNLAHYVDQVYGGGAPLNALTVTLATYAFAYQIYCDFSGYSNIARGLSKLMGIELMKNFDIPYIASTPSEFWRRWHISLSTWLRDYLYIPLGGNRGTGLLTYRNLMLTMVLGGLWHGAAWNFVLWGFFHGLILIVYRRLKIRGPKSTEISWRAVSKRWGAILFMFHLTCVGWFLFRVESLAQISAMLQAFAAPVVMDTFTLMMMIVLTISMALLWPVEIWLKNADNPQLRPGWAYAGPVLVGCLLVALILLAPQVYSSFIYFQF